MNWLLFFLFFTLSIAPLPVFASSHTVNLTQHWAGYLSLAIFGIAYLAVIFEERIDLRKSKPVMASAGLIWVVIAVATRHSEETHVGEAISHNFLEYAELFFFLLVAMTYINAMLERKVFSALRDWLILRGLSYRSLFWITGVLAFCISPIADNLTTALIMCAVVLAMGKGQSSFIAVGCINIVVAANAGGAFSPFGDITTLMVWQEGVIEFTTFFKLFIPSLVNWLVPAFFMQFAAPKGYPPRKFKSRRRIRKGGLTIVVLFLATITTTVCVHNFFHLPPVFGMMFGLAYLKLYSYYLQRCLRQRVDSSDMPTHDVKDDFDVFDKIAKAEWDTLFFFYGVILAVGGLGYLGYLSVTSEYMYGELGPTTANVMVGLLSAIVDNIPVMFAVLTMEPAMDQFQWLLVTLTAGVGGSLLSIGSAAGVALMGQARGHYTFFSHLKYTPIIALGYAASIGMHFWIN